MKYFVLSLFWACAVLIAFTTDSVHAQSRVEQSAVIFHETSASRCSSIPFPRGFPGPSKNFVRGLCSLLDALLEYLEEHNIQTIEELFDLLDSDNDGYISEDEIRDFLSDLDVPWFLKDELVDRIMELGDLDGDGYLTDADFRVVFEDYLQQLESMLNSLPPPGQGTPYQEWLRKLLEDAIDAIRRSLIQAGTIE